MDLEGLVFITSDNNGEYFRTDCVLCILDSNADVISSRGVARDILCKLDVAR